MAEQTSSPLAVFRHELGAMEQQFTRALPPQIRPELFARTVQTAVANNPALLKVERRSLWNAVIKCAQDGLLPDGREAALVVYQDKRRGEIAQYLPMIAGIRKKVRQSGEIVLWECHVVHANDRFDYELGDEPKIVHRPNLLDPGPVIAAYSIARTRSGDVSREIMSIAQIEHVRARSRARGETSPWHTDFEEMARKTVAKRHSKILPMSTDLETVFRRDDEELEEELPPLAAPRRGRPPAGVSARLDTLVRPQPQPAGTPMSALADDSEDPPAGFEHGETIDQETGEISGGDVGEIVHALHTAAERPDDRVRVPRKPREKPAEPTVDPADYKARWTTMIEEATDAEQLARTWNSAAQRKLRAEIGLSVDESNEIRTAVESKVRALVAAAAPAEPAEPPPAEPPSDFED